MLRDTAGEECRNLSNVTRSGGRRERAVSIEKHKSYSSFLRADFLFFETQGRVGNGGVAAMK